MCRISGAYDQDKFKRVISINCILEKQHSGGPDSRGVVSLSDDDTTFGHNRLAIIDLTSFGDQPQYTDRYWLTYNGEIYNYEEFAPLSRNDTHALLYTIENNGIENTLPLLNGMFAIGLYDRKEKQIHCVVDRFAQKPLYYYHTKNKFYFASWPAALYDLEPSWELDCEALQSYWLLGSVMGQDSLFKGIKKLNASEWLTYDIQTDTVTIKRYWEPKFQDNTNDIEDLVIDAIDKVKVSDVPIHIFLSGGIDSTLVASRFQGGQAIHLDSPEINYAKQVADKFDIKLKLIHPKKIDVEACYTDYVTKSGEPSAAALIPYITAKEASRHGKVGIIANGFDELTFGYNRIHENISGEQTAHLFRGSLGEQGWDMPEIILRCQKHSLLPWYNGGRWLELQAFVQFDLNKTLDFASMCHGFEMRSPALDHRLVEMMLSIHEKEHRKQGNKTILKQMLWKLGFNKAFTDRPKIGFSLHQKPEGMQELINKSLTWCLKEGYLNCDWSKLNPRDKHYIEMATLSFYYWFKTWSHKIA